MKAIYSNSFQLILQDFSFISAQCRMAMIIVGVLGLGVEIPTSTLAEEVSQLSQPEELAEAGRLNQQVIELYQQERYSEAIPLAEQALAIRREQLGNNHPDTAWTLDKQQNDSRLLEIGLQWSFPTLDNFV